MHKGGLGEFQYQHGGIEAARLESAVDVVDNSIPFQLYGRHVDGHGDPMALTLPCRSLLTRSFQHPLTNWNDKAARFERWDELVG